MKSAPSFAAVSYLIGTTLLILLLGIAWSVSAQNADIGDASIAEGDAGTVTLDFSVTLDAACTDGVECTVNYATSDGTATVADSDYVAKSGTVTWAAGTNTPVTVQVTVNGDTVAELDEGITVTLSAPSATVTVGDGSGAGTITNDDAPAFTVADLSAAEADADTTFNVQVTLGNGVCAAAAGCSVEWLTADGTATGGSDYTAVSATALSWAQGESGAKSAAVTVLGDTVNEYDETFTVTLQNQVNGVISDGSATVTITNDDTFDVSIDDVSQAEGDAGTSTFTFTVAATGICTAAAGCSLEYSTTDGTAASGSDYTAIAATTMSWADGAGGAKSIDVTVQGDTSFEAAETFTVGLTSATNLNLVDASGLGTITNDDPDSPPVLAAIGAKNANPGATVAISLSATDVDGHTIAFSVVGNPTGMSLTDNGDGTASLDWASAALGSHDITVTVTANGLTDDETFTLAVARSGGGGGSAVRVTSTTGPEGSSGSWNVDITRPGEQRVYLSGTQLGTLFLDLGGPGEVTITLWEGPWPPGVDGTGLVAYFQIEGGAQGTVSVPAVAGQVLINMDERVASATLVNGRITIVCCSAFALAHDDGPPQIHVTDHVRITDTWITSIVVDGPELMRWDDVGAMFQGDLPTQEGTWTYTVHDAVGNAAVWVYEVESGLALGTPADHDEPDDNSTISNGKDTPGLPLVALVGALAVVAWRRRAA